MVMAPGMTRRLFSGKLQLLKRQFVSAPFRNTLLLATTLMAMGYMGVFTHLAEKDYHTSFSYPLNIDILPLVDKLRNGLYPSNSIQPINIFNYSYLKSCRHKCEGVKDGPRLLFVIKSARPHSEQRLAIRQTWGNEKRFSDISIRTVFLLGTASHSNDESAESELLIEEEDAKYGDIVQADFVDVYGNNTLKTMSGLKWVVEHCPHARYVVFSDDDMYISTRNVLHFIRNPSNYPDYDSDLFEMDTMLVLSHQSKEHRERSLKQQVLLPEEELNRPALFLADAVGSDENESDDLKLYAGFVFHSSPLRHRTSKWYVSLAEYPFHLWPPYVTAGAYVLSRSALFDLHYGSAYTQYFRFDDVFLGLVARKTHITPIHCPEFYFWKKDYSASNPHSYRHVIASHGYGDPAELRQIWHQQKRLGYA